MGVWGSAGLLLRLIKFHGPNARPTRRKTAGARRLPIPKYRGQERDIRVRAIIRQACANQSIPIRNFFSTSRKPRCVQARWEAAYRLRAELKLSLPRISEEFGGRHHTAILHAVRRHAELHGLPMPKIDARFRPKMDAA